MRLTWLIQALLCWGTASLVFAVLCALVLGESDDSLEIEEAMRVEVLEELREHAWLN